MATVNDKPANIPSTTTDPGMPALAAIDGDPRTAWGIRFGEARNPFLAVRFSEPAKTSAKSRIVVTLRHESELRKAVIGRFRLALAADPYAWPPIADAGERERSTIRPPGLAVSRKKSCGLCGGPPKIATRRTQRAAQLLAMVQAATGH